MEAKSYPQEEQYLSELSIPIDFKIQCNQYHMSPKKSKAVPNEVTINQTENAQSLLKAANDATIFASTAFPVSMIDKILPFFLLLQFIHLYDNNQNLSKKSDV